ncbi:MAG: class I SAM-dependent methyltransferase [Proteobacteria bacterium]|nr:class I SAM-dependent methyltransferase [Pseudomonadota bacterium]
MSFLKSFVSLFPGGKKLAEKHSYRRRSRLLERAGDTEDRFTAIYKQNQWKNEESRSGEGSTLEYTRNIRKEIPLLIERYGFKTILDAPCGDYHWFQHIERAQDTQYLGADIVEPLIAANQENFGNENTRFVHLDIITWKLPDADLWLCRDCLFHLSYDDIFSVIDNFLNSNIRYLLTSTHPDCDRNIDIPTGHFRLLNLELLPFSFCKPILTIDDWIEGMPVRYLALWEKKDLAAMQKLDYPAPVRPGTAT